MSISQQISSAGTLLSAVDAVRNVRALLVLLGALVLGALVWALGGYLTFRIGFLAGMLFFLIGAAITFYGGNAAGIMLMDEARGSRSRPIASAVLTSLAISHRLLLALLLFGALYLAGFIVLALVLLICKIPFLGPLLYTVVFPVSVVVVGIAVFALYAVIFPLAAPAVWDGAGTMQTVSRLLAVARSRIVNVLIMMALLFFLTGIVFGFIAMIMFAGTAVTVGMSAGILDMGGGLMGMMGGMAGYGGYGMPYGGGGGGYMVAAAVGGGIVYALAFSLPLLVYLRGCCQVYLINLQGVDVQGMEAQLRDTMDAARRKADELRAQAAQAAAAAATPAPAPAAQTPPPATPSSVAPVAPESSPPAASAPPLPPPTPAVEPPPAAPVYKCPQCGVPYLPGDGFCGNCGYKLAR
jgi:hypothetical protein